MNNGQNANNTINVQEIVQAVVQMLDARQRVQSQARSTPFHEDGNSSVTDTSIVNWQQIKFATKLILPFAGRDYENVTRWLKRISSVARMYKLKDETITRSGY